MMVTTCVAFEEQQPWPVLQQSLNAHGGHLLKSRPLEGQGFHGSIEQSLPAARRGIGLRRLRIPAQPA